MAVYVSEKDMRRVEPEVRSFGLYQGDRGNFIGHMNKVTLHRARLVLRWVTVQYTVLVFNQAT